MYQLVYKCCYHGEVYRDRSAVPLPSDEPCPAADILEVIAVEIPGRNREEKCAWLKKNRHRFCGGIGSYFMDRESAVAAMRQI